MTRTNTKARPSIPADISTHYGDMRDQFAYGGPEAETVANTLSTFAAAGEYAIAKGLVPLPKGAALKACKLLFREWLETVGSRNTEDGEILQAIADFITTHGDSRFSSIHERGDACRVIHNRAGFYEEGSCGERRVYLFMSKPLKEAAWSFPNERILQALETAGALLPGDSESGQNRRQKTYRKADGGTGRFYVIDREKLQTTN